MTDLELLELAAKAAGAEHNGYRYGENGREPLYGMPIETEDGFEYRKWNPLEDDGDALRLAVRLAIHIEWGKADLAGGRVVHVHTGTASSPSPYVLEPDYEYRRAIVRAAAEIGRAMP